MSKNLKAAFKGTRSRRPSPAICSAAKLPKRINGVLVPADYSFEAVNEFVHAPDVHFEELQWALLGIATKHGPKSGRRPRGKCSGCGWEHALDSDGKIWNHVIGTEQCCGSKKPPTATRRCDSCGEMKPVEQVEDDEGDFAMCHSCIKIWEAENKARWADGAPLPPNKALSGGTTNL